MTSSLRHPSYELRRHLAHLLILPLGVLTQVGFNSRFSINLVMDLFAIGGLGFPLLSTVWLAAVIHAWFVILKRK